MLGATAQRLRQPQGLTTLGFVVIGIAIVCNALFLQARRHPAPFVWTQRHAEEPVRPEADPLVRSVQDALKQAGFYDGPLDGLAGPRTHAAIAAFETRAGRPATGEASLDLLKAIHAGAPSTTLPAPQPTAPQTVAADTAAETQAAPLPPAADPMVYAVQDALARSGYGPLDVDGFPGPATNDAVTRFQRDHALPVTGEISERLVVELRASGALQEP